MDASAASSPPPSPSSDPPCPPCRQSSSLLQLDCFAPSDGFFVDELLDFPFDGDVSCLALDDGSSGSPTPHSMELSVCGASAGSLSGLTPLAAAGESVDGQGIGQPSVSELCVPSDELADQLEWLSGFVEDSSYAADTTLALLVSSSDLSACMPESSSDAPRTREAFQSPSPVSVLEQAGGTFSGRAWCLSPFFAVPGRARSKRSRTGGRIWSLDTLIPVSLDNKVVSQDNMLIDCPGESSLSSPLQEGDVPSVRPSKKTKKASAAAKSVDTSQPRKCAHCLVQKTPQWRAGPMGPKTLCNACGVRYKSGRLVPEYRPACSPSFVSEVHSNSHKRILEMRRLKEFEAWEGHRPSGQHLDCKREAVDAKPAAGAATVEEGAQKADEVTEDDCHSQNRAREEDITEDYNEVEESQNENGTIIH